MNVRLMMMACCVLTAFTGKVWAEEDDSAGAGYAKLLMLSSTEDISASSFRLDGGVRFNKFSLPFEIFNLDVTDRFSFAGTVRGSYLNIKGHDDEDDLDTRFKWDILSVMTGLIVRYHPNDEVALKSGIELGYARLNNRVSFSGGGLDEESAWDLISNNGLIAPMIGVEYDKVLDTGDSINAEANLSWMHVSSFNENDRLVKIDNEKAGTWSLKGEYTFGDAYRLLGRPMDVMVANKLGGFYGKGYRDIDMGFMNNTELATGTRIKIFKQSYNVRIGVGYLTNDVGHGISLVMRVN